MTWLDSPPPPAGNTSRYGGRWRLVAAGVSNVWRYGDLDLDAVSGRLLLRGPNGTGKTTALEILWPYLLDLNPALLGAGKARNTHLSQLMREGAEGRRRVGFAWLSFAGPGRAGTVSYGVRLNFSEGSTPPVKIAPFCVPARPLHDFALWGPGRATPSVDQFADAVAGVGGTVFVETDDYVRDLSSRVFATDSSQVVELARRIREVRNPALLATVSPAAAAEALKVALPGVAEEVLEATGDALAESAATRTAFENDRAAAEVLEGFASVWVGHAIDVARTYGDRAEAVQGELRRHRRDVKKRTREHADALDEESRAESEHAKLRAEVSDTAGRLQALERSAEYRDAGRLAELARTADSLAKAATACWGTLVNTTEQARRHHDDDHRHGEYLADDLDNALGEVSELAPGIGTGVLRISKRARTRFAVGDRSVDAGPALEATVDVPGLDAAVAALGAEAGERTRRGDAARLYLHGHEPVAAAASAAEDAREEAGRLAAAADHEARKARTAVDAAARHAFELGVAMRSWRAGCHDDPGWGDEDLDAIGWTEPAGALAGAESLAVGTSRWAHTSEAAASTRAAALVEHAHALRQEAAELRSEAVRIREHDILLPLPRPAWSGSGDDTVALGAAIDWVDGTAAEVQGVVESTLAAAGILGATVDADGARTSTWSVDLAGAPTPSNLTSVLRGDADHPLSDVALAVLERIALGPTAADADGSRVSIGLDGTFRAGVMLAVVPEAHDAELRRPAAHIGARRRRAAALAHADALDLQAGELESEAARSDAEAAAAIADAARVLDLLARFPSRDDLRGAEATRVAAVRDSRDAEDAAAAAEAEADLRADTAAAELRRWVTDVSGAGLPPDVIALGEIAEESKRAADLLRRVAGHLDTKHRSRLLAFAATVAAHDMDSALAASHAEARTAHDVASEARAVCDELRGQLGAGPEAVLARHSALAETLVRLRSGLDTADGRRGRASAAAAAAEAHLADARARIAEVEPTASHAVGELRALFALDGVAEAVLGAEADGDGPALLAQVSAAVAGRPTSARRTLRERADETRARLAGVWSLDPGTDHAELDTHLLTHGAATFTPVGAAGHARILADRAEEALRAADEAALRDFVIGRLPQAIATAWASLHDWVGEVNKKMRSASASSGVGVSVRVRVRDDLSPVVRTVYELVCKTGDALRDPEAKKTAGQAIQQLIAAADGDDMGARVATAVDVRDWVDVTYHVTRPGEDPRPWNSRTGLSGGERRLVVLAPMLAAVAAAYDRLGEAAGRVAALDEIPSEVDAEGREGLARYIAALDLDLIATSHHWDGAPGAWDGIDAHDLEAAPDGTVVAFPMRVRAALPLPGDPMLA